MLATLSINNKYILLLVRYFLMDYYYYLSAVGIVKVKYLSSMQIYINIRTLERTNERNMTEENVKKLNVNSLIKFHNEIIDW